MKKVVCLLLVLFLLPNLFAWKHKRLSVKDEFGDEIRKDDYYIFGEDNSKFTDKYIWFFNSELSFSNGYIHFGGEGDKKTQNSVNCIVKIKCDDGKLESFQATGKISSNYIYWRCLVSLDSSTVNKMAGIFSKNNNPKLVVQYGNETYNFGTVSCSDFTSNQSCIKNGHKFNSALVCETCGVSLLNMVKVEGGSFTLGDGSQYGNKPVGVTLSDFYISDCEVTQKIYETVMGKNPSEFKGEDLPVENVTWYDAVKFCNKLSEISNLTPAYTIKGKDVTCNVEANGYRLPTEAEWEYAARGGKESKGYKYSGSNTIGDVAWHHGNSSRRTHVVKTKGPNELGLYDMSGNVEEWCWDWYGSYSGGSNPVGAVSGSSRVVRGGRCWFSSDDRNKVSNRDFYTPDESDNNRGFRVVRSCQ